MFLKKIIIASIISFYFVSISGNAQNSNNSILKVIKGKVTDLTTSEPIPFATVFIKGTGVGVSTDFNGEYEIRTVKDLDSLTAQYLGYLPKSKFINKQMTSLQINFQLDPNAHQLDEVVILPGENPAWVILRKIIKNKDKNNRSQLSSAEYQSYTRNEICLDNISEKLKKNVLLGSVANVLDKAQKVADDEGRPVIPVFVSEVISKNYYRSNPKKTKEIVQNSKVSGVGIGDNSIINQFLGVGLQNINFYNNYSNILTKDFVSPICDEWKINYRYYLLDSIYINKQLCYEIKFVPKNKFSLAYSGKMWIDHADYSIVQIDAQISKDANINYMERIKVQHEFIKIDSSWLLSNARLLICVSKFSSYSTGILIKSNSKSYNYTFSNPKPISFFDNPYEVIDNDSILLQNFDSIRPHKLTADESAMYKIIDSVKNVPQIKRWLSTFNFITSGYRSFGKIELGPYPFIYAYNQFEKHRFRVDFRTTPNFNKNWLLKGYLAVSTGDTRFIKPEIDFSRILSRKKYCEVGIKYHFDAEQVGVSADNLNFNTNFSSTTFAALSRFGKFRYPYYLEEWSLYCNTELRAGLIQNFQIKRKLFSPEFDFRIHLDDTKSKSHFISTEFTYDFKYSPGEMGIRNKRNKRIKVKTNRNNFIYKFRYTYGSNLLGDFEYHKFYVGLNKAIRFGFFGKSTLDVQLAYTPSKIPFPLLFIHQGNPSIVYLNSAYNQMNYMEFVSDKYASLSWHHDFEGLIFNHIPIIQKWGWRNHIVGKALFGSLDDRSRSLQDDYTDTGFPIPKIKGLDINTPYIELGYGISNILKCLRIDFIHRITYLNSPKAHPLELSYLLN